MTPATLTRAPSNGAVGALFLVAVSVALLAAPVWPPLNAIWLEHFSSYNHGYLVIAVAAWLVVHELRRKPLGAFAPSLLGLASLAAATAAMVVARVADILHGAELLVFVLPLVAFWALAGASIAKRFVLSAAYCLFALPLWSFPNTVLRDVTVACVAFGVRLSAIPAYIDASFIHLPAGTIYIEATCSGLRYFIVACALATYYGAVTYAHWRPRLVLIGAAGALAMVANWVRIYILVVVGYLSQMQNYLIRVDHIVFGWVLFFVFFAPFYFAVQRLERRFGYVDVRATGGARPRGPGPLAWGTRHYATAGVACLLLLGGAAMTFLALPPDQATPLAPAHLPAKIGGWTRTGSWQDASMPHYLGADRQRSAWYRRGASRIGLYVADYGVQLQGKEVVHGGNSPAGQGTILRRSTADHGAVGELEVGSSAGRRLVLYSYAIAGRRTASDFWAKVYQVLGALGRRWRARVVVVSAGCGEDCGAARHSLHRFMDEARAAIEPGS